MEMNSKPLAVMYGRLNGDTIAFSGRNGYIQWDWKSDIFASVLEHCIGLHTVSDIAKIINHKPPLVLQMIRSAEEYGIVQDSSTLFYQFHQDSSNPIRFSKDFGTKELSLLHERELSWPVDDGSSHQIATPVNSEFLKLLGQRTSSRNFVRKPMALNELNGLLTACYSRIATPSAGSLRPMMPFVYLFDSVAQIAGGLYQYRWDSQSLVRSAYQPSSEELLRAFPEEFLTQSTQCLLVYVLDTPKIAPKYGNRSYRYALLEAGHCAQNIYLWGCENNFGVLEYGGFLDKELSVALSLDLDSQLILTTLFVGKTASATECMIRENSLSSYEALVRQIDFSTSEIQPATLLELPEQVSYQSYSNCEYRINAETPAQIACGSGVNMYQAKFKATVEAIERLTSQEVRIDMVNAAESMAGQWLDPREVAPLSSAQYRLNPQLQPFDTKSAWQWVEGYFWRSERKVHVPIDLAYYPIDYHLTGRKLCTYASSSGVAAHTSVELAVKSGWLELIERDAFCRSWYSGLDCAKTVRPANLGNAINKYTEKYRTRGVEISFLDLRPYYSDTHVVACLMRDGGKRARLGVGAAATYESLTEAANRAFYEAEFMFLTRSTTKGASVRSMKEVVSVADHINYYQFSERQRYLDSWFGYKPQRNRSKGVGIDSVDPVVVILGHKFGLDVVRVIDVNLVPISFGFGLEYYLHRQFQGWFQNRVYRFPSKPHCFG
jgi:thiazole/oxazole-forming peptide maturase SagD family component